VILAMSTMPIVVELEDFCRLAQKGELTIDN
jgi:hypothetical protein